MNSTNKHLQKGGTQKKVTPFAHEKTGNKYKKSKKSQRGKVYDTTKY
jgi:hypothetical protein